MFKYCAKKTKLSRFLPKKRYFFAIFLAIELASLPAAAQILQKVAFQTRPYVTAVKVPSQKAGTTRFLVISNAPFTVRSQDMLGDMDISVHKSGKINGKRFGDNAQMPGIAAHCASAVTSAESIIYQAERKTALNEGHPVSQAVIMEVSYDEIALPKISFRPDTAPLVPLAANCDMSQI